MLILTFISKTEKKFSKGKTYFLNFKKEDVGVRSSFFVYMISSSNSPWKKQTYGNPISLQF